jgi:hypothetical protein
MTARFERGLGRLLAQSRFDHELVSRRRKAAAADDGYVGARIDLSPAVLLMIVAVPVVAGSSSHSVGSTFGTAGRLWPLSRQAWLAGRVVCCAVQPILLFC